MKEGFRGKVNCARKRKVKPGLRKFSFPFVTGEVKGGMEGGRLEKIEKCSFLDFSQSVRRFIQRKILVSPVCLCLMLKEKECGEQV